MVKYNFMKARQLRTENLFKPTFVKNKGVVFNYSLRNIIDLRLNTFRHKFLHDPMGYFSLVITSVVFSIGISIAYYRVHYDIGNEKTYIAPVMNYLRYKDDDDYVWNNLYQTHEKKNDD